jgi:cytochrome c-type biogenesis protein CcmH/NrfG
MGLFSGLLKLPTAPVRGVVWVADQVLQEAERQYYDPALIRQQLDEVDQLRREDLIDPEEADRREEELIARLMREKPRE